MAKISIAERRRCALAMPNSKQTAATHYVIRRANGTTDTLSRRAIAAAAIPNAEVTEEPATAISPRNVGQ